jgi:hypothetical protein
VTEVDRGWQRERRRGRGEKTGDVKGDERR